MEQASLFDWSPPRARTAYPSAPGAKREGTSQYAADAMAPKAPKLRDRVLAELTKGQGTADEVAGRLGLSVLSVRPRFTELSLAGKIEETGERRKNESGMTASVWRVIVR